MIPIYENVTQLSHNDIVEKFGEIDFIKQKGDITLAQVGMIEMRL